MALVTNLIARQVHFYPATIDEQEAAKNRKDFDALVALRILERNTTTTHRICPTCNGEALEVQIVSETRAYTLCTIDEAAGRDYFNPDELKQWRLNTPRLLSLFQEAIGISTPEVKESIHGLLWDLGTQNINGLHYHLFFCRNVDEIDKPRLSIITALPRSVLFYSGTPHVALPDSVLIAPIADFIKSIGKTIVTEKTLVSQYFPKGVYATKEGDIVLDDNIVLQDNCLLFKPLKAGRYQKKSAKLRPRASRIIEHLYTIRTYQQNSKTLEELATDMGSSKRSVSNEIKRITEIAAKNNLPSILHKYAGDRWGINPQLTCCR